MIIAREFSRGGRLLVAAQPTRGVDVGSTEFIHRKLVEARDGGMAVLLVSAELEEVLEPGRPHRGDVPGQGRRRARRGRSHARSCSGYMMATGIAPARCHAGGAAVWVTSPEELRGA